MIKFLKKKSDMPFTLAGYLEEKTERYQEPRSYLNIHASELTREEVEFCPRERALILLHKMKSPPKYVGSALGLTFDIGEEYSTLIRERYLKSLIVGDWRCTHCGHKRVFSRYPTSPCENCKGKNYKYEEHRFYHESGAGGGIDAIIAVPKQPLLQIVEIKSLSKDEFKDLKFPASEHRIRTVLYLEIIKSSSNAQAKQINTDFARIIYVSKGFGVQGMEGFSPYKEFIINRTDADVTHYLNRAQALNTFFYEGVVPEGICASCNTKRALKCNAKKVCWDTYPAGTITEALKV